MIGLKVEGGDGRGNVGADVVQLVRPAISAGVLLALVPSGSRLYTFNGHSFDLPVLRKELGADLRARCDSIDLMTVTGRAGLRGGQKAIEARLHGAGGFSAPPPRPKPNTFDLWDRWLAGDRAALEELLAYNRADVLGLVQIRDAMLFRGGIPARFG